ncbi:ATP-binding cassette domain-containing protein, partial [Aeromonas veronii]|nr:ATP-binding cassette domain-containing protein [Aeromonas veronii]
TLSGGEKARLALSKLMMEKSNFLILDEPTNHLNLDSKEVLENALIDYPGTILFVSHDRYFINRIATKVFELSSEGLTEYLGDYDYHLEKKFEMEELARLEAKESKNVKREVVQEKTSYEQEKQLKKLERQRKRRIEEIELEISTIEEKIEENEHLLCDPEVYQNHEEVQRINEENEKASTKLEALMEEWESLHEVSG